MCYRDRRTDEYVVGNEAGISFKPGKCISSVVLANTGAVHFQQVKGQVKLNTLICFFFNKKAGNFVSHTTQYWDLVIFTSGKNKSGAG